MLVCWSALITVTFSCLALLYALIRQNYKTEKLARDFMYLYGKGCMGIISPWVKVKKINIQSLTTPCIVAANHLSMLDLTCLPFLPESNICVMIKAWPAKLPLMGMFVKKANYINVDELSAAQILDRVKDEISKKSVLVVFPEGRRSPDGKLRRLRSGAFKLAIATGLPIYPLRYTGTNNALPVGGFKLYAAEITMRLFAKVSPQAFTEADERRAHKHMAVCVKARLQEAA
jgi:1-acyl-sn-glycerol-3-phosphate acyltransferase